MAKKRFWAVALSVVVVLAAIGLVFGGGVMLGLRLTGLREGLVHGLPDPDVVHRFGSWGRPAHVFPGFIGGGLLRAGLFLVFLLLVGKMLRHAAWGCRPAAGPRAPHWHSHWHGFHGPPPSRGPGKEKDEATAKVRPGAPGEEAVPSDDVEG